MRICIPVLNDEADNSLVSAHFGSAPAFMIVDTDAGTRRFLANGNQHHAHGMCQPLAALAGEQVDAIVVGGIGMGALMKLQSAGIEVFQAAHPTVGETVEAYRAGLLQRVGREHACAGHHGAH